MNKDLGITTCTLKVTDSVGLSTSTVLFITVVPCSIPLNFIDLADQDLKVGEVRFVNVRVNNPCGLPPIALSLPIAPNYVTLTDAGNGTGTVRIAPQRGDIGGRIIIEARDSVGLFTQSSFNISLKIGGTVSSVNFSKPNLTISGNGFGNGGARISINNMDVTSRINTQNDTLITLRGNKKRLNLKTGPNLIRITPASNNGTDILEFVFDF
ncbi:MAG: hypothetical protein JNN15_07705 [Blastocatellia bacterium]|nr:hypothetical protein [Blastocatellia bacterium]